MASESSAFKQCGSANEFIPRVKSCIDQNSDSNCEIQPRCFQVCNVSECCVNQNAKKALQSQLCKRKILIRDQQYLHQKENAKVQDLHKANRVNIQKQQNLNRKIQKINSLLSEVLQVRNQNTCKISTLKKQERILNKEIQQVECTLQHYKDLDCRCELQFTRENCKQQKKIEEINRKHEAVEDREESHTELHEELDELEAELERTEKQLSELFQYHKSVSHRMVDLENEVKNLDCDFKQLRQYVCQTEEELADKLQEEQCLSEKRQRLSCGAKLQKQKLNHMQELIQEKQPQLEQCKVNECSFKQQLAAAEMRADKYEHHLCKVEQQVDRLQAAQNKLRQEYNVQDCQLDSENNKFREAAQQEQL